MKDKSSPPDGASDDSASPAPKPTGRRILLGVLAGAVLYGAMALWADLSALLTAVAEMPWTVLPLACALSFANYALRFPRWQRYLHLLDVRLARPTSFLVYLAGLSLTVTPGKLGEAYKSFLLKDLTGTPIHRSAPIVIAERVTDLFGFLLLLALGGLVSHPEQRPLFAAVTVLCLGLVACVSSPRLSGPLLRLCRRLPLLSSLSDKLEGALESTRILLAPREIPRATLLATLGWGLECYAFFLVAEALVPGAITFQFATFAFALSAILGAVVIIFPGGLGITEASLGSLLGSRFTLAGLAAEAARTQAFAATILIRLCTLWFAVFLGLLATFLLRRSMRRSP
ncbi:MAG: TIGR00374 family protein [Planctomycetes bacterium]|nr:TIGR00374 family protein [Planctomycetota bacterium]MDP6519522.1 lysylphosphatidylglycerol synthase transmembrane domain-containing protein [Planctomycetota bacterium]